MWPYQFRPESVCMLPRHVDTILGASSWNWEKRSILTTIMKERWHESSVYIYAYSENKSRFKQSLPGKHKCLHDCNFRELVTCFNPYCKRIQLIRRKCKENVNICKKHIDISSFWCVTLTVQSWVGLYDPKNLFRRSWHSQNLLTPDSAPVRWLFHVYFVK